MCVLFFNFKMPILSGVECNIKSLRFHSIYKLTPVSWMIVDDLKLLDQKEGQFVTYSNSSSQSICIFVLIS